MRCIKQVFGLAAALCFVANAQAANYHFVAMADLADTVAAANAGDTIIITDSGTLEADLVLDKQLYIMAADGETPVLIGDPCVEFTNDADGSMFGSNVGGTIQLGDDTDVPTTWTDSDWIRFDDDAGDFDGSITFENLDIWGTDHVWYSKRDITSVGVITFNDVDFHTTHTWELDDGEWEIVENRFIYMRHDGTMNLNRCFTEGALRPVHTHEKGRGGWDNRTININNCEFRHDSLVNDIYVPFGSDEGLINRFQNEHVTINVDRSVLIGQNGVMVQDANATIGLENSVVVAMGATTYHTYDHDGYSTTPEISAQSSPAAAISLENRFYSSSRWYPDQFAILGSYTADHCDLISSGSVLYLGDFSEPLFLDYSSTGRQVTITNSNLIALNSDPVVTATLRAQDSISLDHCNLYAAGSGGLWGGDAHAGMSTNGYSVDPGYIDSGTNYDFDTKNTQYNEGTLLTGDDSGGPVGSYLEAWQFVPVELSTFSIQ
jgi:hypothetical protein